MPVPVEQLEERSTTADVGRQEEGVPTRLAGGGELDLFGFVLLLRANLRRTLLFGVVTAILVALLTLVVHPQYDALASVLIPKPTTNPVKMALEAAAGGLDLGGGGTDKLYTDILKSRTVADTLIRRFHLVAHYREKEEVQAEKTLAKATTIVASAEGLIKVTVRDSDPRMAADLANGYMSELDQLNQHLAITSAAQQRQYYEQQMVQEKNALADAEVALQASQEKSGVLQPQLQAAADLGASESTRAQLREYQVELGALLQRDTPENPEVVRMRAQIASLESQLNALHSGGGPAAGVPAAKLPAQATAYVRALREVKFHEALFELLARSYEAAKQQEAKDVSMIELLDNATPPAHKAWPPRTIYTVLAFFLGIILGMLYTAFQAFTRTVMMNPENRSRYAAVVSGAPLVLAKHQRTE